MGIATGTAVAVRGSAESEMLKRWLWTVVALYVLATCARVYVRKYYVFLPGYFEWSVRHAASSLARPHVEGPTHVFFVFVDHFEPDYDAGRVERWAARYRRLAAAHRDIDGRSPQHTWFYPGEQNSPAVMQTLAQLTRDGFGEVELHYHHDFDTADTFRPKLEAAIRDFQQYGFLKTTDGRTCFAFIHGNEGLDNSTSATSCGVDTELRLLHDLGCYADFTFPAVFTDAQPPVVNEIYAARDTDVPKSYSNRWPLSTIVDGTADLMIFQGPLVFAPSLRLSHLFLDLDDGNIHPAVPASPSRVDRWIAANIHVPGRPDWIFVKIFTHGINTAADEQAVVGPTFDTTLTYLERTYNDGRRYALHYVTSREAYNLVLAATVGGRGDPTRYYDTPIPPYVADGSRTALEASLRSR